MLTEKTLTDIIKEVELYATRKEEVMVDLEKLKAKIKDSGMTVVAISQKSGILRETLYNKLNGKSEFSASEILSLTEVLSLTRNERDAIFFADNVA